MTSEQRVAKDKVVTFRYQITDLNGEVIERVDLPMNYIFGRHNRLYDKVENAMLNKIEGDEVAVKLLPSECAWGESDPALIFTDAFITSPLNIATKVRKYNSKMKRVKLKHSLLLLSAKTLSPLMATIHLREKW